MLQYFAINVIGPTTDTLNSSEVQQSSSNGHGIDQLLATGLFASGVIAFFIIVWLVFLIILLIKIWNMTDDISAIRGLLERMNASGPSTPGTVEQERKPLEFQEDKNDSRKSPIHFRPATFIFLGALVILVVILFVIMKLFLHI